MKFKLFDQGTFNYEDFDSKEAAIKEARALCSKSMERSIIIYQEVASVISNPGSLVFDYEDQAEESQP